MKPEQIFPTIIILLNLGSFVMYAWAGDVRKATYWLAAAFLTASVTY